MQLDHFPRLSLAHLPTPLEPLPRLSEYLGGPQIFVKRDDCTGLGTGGNKTRKLEFLMAEAIEQGADTIVTVGGPQSNHARQTAAAAARLGLECVLVLPHISRFESPTYVVSGNVLLDKLFGAKVHLVADEEAAAEKLAEVVMGLHAEDRKPHFIPAGGSTPVGSLGYVAAVDELLQQADAIDLKIDHMLVTTGSCSTHAGLVAGLAALERPEKVIGVSVYLPGDEPVATVTQKARETLDLMEIEDDTVEQRVEVLSDYRGDGYGEPTPAMIEAVKTVARLEGLLLDPVYTGKTMSGLIDLVRKGRFQSNENIVFWHTGGTPALFPYGDLFAE